MSDSFERFLAGTITRCNLVNPNKWGQYSVHIKGYYEDTHDTFDGYLNSKYPVNVYEGNDDPIDPNDVVGEKFDGRVMVTQKEYNGKNYLYLKAVSVEKRLGKDETTLNKEKEETGNPFLKNPLSK